MFKLIQNLNVCHLFLFIFLLKMNNGEFIELTYPNKPKPSQQEIKEYAQWLGADIETDQDLFYIAREALMSDLPKEWKIYQKNDGGDPFFFNTKTGESIWDHPLDDYYKELFREEKQMKTQNASLKNVIINLPLNEPKILPNQIKLTTNFVLTVPFQIYEKDFTFIVNNTKYKTNKIFADILSPKISRIHFTDPTFDTFSINTKSKGDFNNVLNLLNFQYNKIPTEEVPFMIEVIEILEIKSVKSNFYRKPLITVFNVIDIINEQQKCSVFYKDLLQGEIDFLSSHFYEIAENQREKLKALNFETIQRIVENENLVLKSEDQLLSFVNELNALNSDFSILYGYVNFLNVSLTSITNFLNTFDIENINQRIWNNIAMRLQNEIFLNSSDSSVMHSIQKEYEKVDKKDEKEDVNVKNILFDGKDEFDGIINHLRKELVPIEVTASSTLDDKHLPANVIFYNNNNIRYFCSKDLENSFVCIDFKDYSVIPLKYAICGENSSLLDKRLNPKEWIIEGSNDGISWYVIDFQKDVLFTSTRNYMHVFTIQYNNENSFRYLRMRMTGKNWEDNYTFKLGSIEFFGKLIH